MKFIQPVLALSGAGLAIAGGTLTIGGGPGPACSSATAAIPTCAVGLSSRASFYQYIIDSYIY